MKRYIPALLLFCLVAPLHAQVATVEVSRAYDVRLDDIRKPAIPTSVDDSLQRFDVKFDYSIFNRPYTDLYDFTPYESIQLSTVGANRTPFVYSRLGMQYAPRQGIMPAGELYLQTKPKNGFCSGLYGRHQSFFGTVEDGLNPNYLDRNSKMQNTVGGDLTYDWATGELMVDLKYDFDRYGYYASAKDYPDDIVLATAHRNNSFTGSFNLNSAQKEDNTIYYDVTLSYRNTNKSFNRGFPVFYDEQEVNLSEGFLNVNGYVGSSFDKHRVYVDMNIEYASYGGLHDFQVGVVEFSPIYKIQRKRLDAKLGVKFGSRYGIAGTIDEPGLDLGAHSSIFPDLDVRFTIAEKTLWAHAVVTGGNDLNPYSRMIDDCPVVSPYSTMEFGSRPLDATFSLEGVFGGRLGINLEGNYKIYRNKMIFAPFYDLKIPIAELMASYRDVNQFSLQGEVFWRSQELTLGGRLRYADYRNREDKSVLTEMPAWTGNAFARYNFRERIIAQVECNYRGSTSGGMLSWDQETHKYLPNPAHTYEVPAVVDIDVNVNYLINKHFSVFAKVGNLLNHRNEYMPLYLEPGRNFGGGVTINF